MGLKILEESLIGVLKDIEKRTFPNLIRECRDVIGLKMYRAAEYAGMHKTRLNNLELGFFKCMPKYGELIGLSDLYNIDKEILVKKAREYINASKQKREIGKEKLHLSTLQKRKS